MKIWHISDTHDYHHLLDIPTDEGIDMVIHSGDASNFRDTASNLPEMTRFMAWFAKLPFEKKIYVAGNHDAAVASRRITAEDFAAIGAIYLEDSGVEIEGRYFYGSPWTPTFNDWHFNRARHKMYKTWRAVPENTHCLITHGPPHGILDLTEKPNTDRQRRHLEMVGDKTLRDLVQAIQCPFHLFGHVHNYKQIRNAGVFVEHGITYSNGSVVTDADFGKVTSNGNILDI